MRDELARYRPGRGQRKFYAGFHTDLEEFVLRPGKRIRPLLFLQACASFDPACDPLDPDLLRTAAGLEFLHAFILIHDDIIDRSVMRRGLPCLHHKLDRRLAGMTGNDGLAIVMGDMLFAISQRILISTCLPESTQENVVQSVLGAVFDTGIGEIADVVFGAKNIAEVDIEDIEEMYYLKTTRYTFEMPLVLAAAVMQQPSSVYAELCAVTKPVGLAFQMQNDLAEFSLVADGDNGFCADLSGGKKTILLRLAWELLDERGRAQLGDALRTSDTESNVTKLTELIASSGAPVVVADRMNDRFIEAEERLQGSRLPEDTKVCLSEMFELIRCAIGRGVPTSGD
jgi:geranylgeranyl diphosphate synthase type I